MLGEFCQVLLVRPRDLFTGNCTKPIRETGPRTWEMGLAIDPAPRLPNLFNTIGESDADSHQEETFGHVSTSGSRRPTCSSRRQTS